ncbi:methyltransferase domain-containing protein [Aurantimonas aggregata]|uniref:Methyltransferase domain-containing protein n=1 Tax=Aurantimonas aggregata TaxID=2047720 RepID=A0A6L9MF70_9HYPH|nr:class I SAM-dependent methyltransferase [Aurantimonas aggregata]NDV86291.1 methyltransferase domain-containing protein [Aurantimonas aggregata]
MTARAMPSPEGSDQHPAVAGYDVIADAFEAARKVKPWELAYFSGLAERLAPGDHLLDCGCGNGHAGLAALVEAGLSITALDGSAGMLRHFRRRYPGIATIRCDMLAHDPAEPFDAIIAWDSFFHLTHDEQARMIRHFAAWLRPGGLLLFTSGPGHSTIDDAMFGTRFAYASYSDAAYREMLGANGLSILASDFDEPHAAIHKVWLAQKE